jgi:hypothetical protein
VKISIWLDFGGGPKLIIKHRTSIFYSNQTGGYGCFQREIEGFLIPFDIQPAEEALERSFKRFKCRSASGRELFTQEEDIELLQQLLQRFSLLKHLPPEEDYQAMFPLELDLERIDELEEGWIPVKTVLGDGILAFENCD